MAESPQDNLFFFFTIYLHTSLDYKIVTEMDLNIPGTRWQTYWRRLDLFIIDVAVVSRAR